MQLKGLLLTLCIANAAMTYGGDISGTCDKQKQAGRGSTAKTTSGVPEEAYYDVQSLKFDIALTNTSSYVIGNVTTRAKVVATITNIYAFELNPLLTIDSIKINNQLLTTSITTTGAIRKVILPTILMTGAIFTAQVFYHGQSVAGGGGQFFLGGMNVEKINSNYNIMYTISDKDFACDWWPSKQNIQDKIDTVQMLVTVDDSLKVGSNGLLQNTVPLPGNRVRYEWKTQYPIDYYLISVAVAPYNEYSYYMHYTDGSNDSMLIQNYYYNTNPLTAKEKSALDSTGLIVDHFSDLFSRYPFDKEKYGHCMSPLFGGMEHQTMTTMGTLAFDDVSLIAHELGHQWWGDHVTYGSWRDIWLSEGFASYCEELFVEHFRGLPAAANYRKNIFNIALTGSGSLYVDDTTSVSRIFNTALTYKKGAAVVHMLRYLAPADSLFFKALRTYQAQYANSFAYTDDLKTIAAQVYNTNLDTFFNQWVYRQGYPIYSTAWYQQGSTLVIRISQTTSVPSSVACFWMPVQIKLKSAAGDKIITLYNNEKVQTFVINWSDEVTGIELDPGNNILKRSNTPTKEAALLNVSNINWNDIEVYPNPSNDEWHIKHMPARTLCRLTDITGKLIWQQQCDLEATVPAKHLAKGNYLLTMTAEGNSSKCIRLVR